MERYKKLLVVLLCLAILVSVTPKRPVYADALTAAMLGDIAYGIAVSSGINFAFSNGTAAGASSWMANQMEQYATGQGMNVVQYFGTDAVLKAGTVLAVGKYTYDKIAGFLGNLVDKFQLGTNAKQLINGDEVNPGGDQNKEGFTWAYGASAWLEIVEGDPYNSYYKCGVGYDGETKRVYDGDSRRGRELVSIRAENAGGNYVKFYFVYTTSTSATGDWLEFVGSPAASSSMSATVGADWTEPQPLPQGKQWEGDFSGTPGFADPPSDLPDFLSRIPVAIADNELQVEEEIVDTGDSPPPSPTPSPTPSPRPTPAPVPEITIAQKIAAILGELLGLIGLTGDTPLTEEQQQQIADASQDIEDSVKDVVQNITDTITQTGMETGYDIQDQTQTITQSQQQIQDAIQTQTDTLTDTLPDIKDATQEMTDTLTDTLPDIKDKLEDITEVPDDFSPQKHPIARGVFPFCIPFDLHDIIVALDADPVTPEIHIPFRIPTIMGINFGLDYTFDLDLHDFDGLAQVLRTLEFIAFGVGLLFVTGKVIKW